MAEYWRVLCFPILFLFSLSRLPLILGAAPQFTEPPVNNLYVLRNRSATIGWSYTFDTKTNFDDNSPVWEYKEDGGTWLDIAFEDGLDGWKWIISSECPAKFKNPVRVEKGQKNAALVIQNTKFDDSGLYRCKLVMKTGNPILSNEVQLIVTDSLPTTTASATTTSPTTITTAKITTEPITTTTSPTSKSDQGLSVEEQVGIGVGVVVGVICIIIVVVLYRKYRKKNKPCKCPADKKHDTEMDCPPGEKNERKESSGRGGNVEEA